MKQLRCKYCNKVMAQIGNGSKLHHKLVCTCSDCDNRRTEEIRTLKDSFSLYKGSNGNSDTKYTDMFQDILRGKF